MVAPFDPSWIVFESPSLIVVDKPAGLATQAQDEGLADDLASRLREHFRLRGDRSPLALHQRLDRETSGLMIFTRGELTAAAARAFESREVVKEYVAGVVGDPGGARTLRHTLTPRTRGRVRVAPGGKEALTDLRVVQRRGERALVALRPRTGRTHQLRVQLAAIGCPIAGDALYGDRPAARMMLHATRLEITLGGVTRVFESPLPAEFVRFIEGADGVDVDDDAALSAALERALLRRGALLHPPEDAPATELFRLFHREGDGAAPIAVDRYGDFLVLHAYEEQAPLELDVPVRVLSRLGYRGIYLKRRRRTTHRGLALTTEEAAPAEPVWGEAAPFEMTCREHGVGYPVRLGDGLSTGIFLDQRENRRRLTEEARGASVLNLFAYAGAFTAAAVQGGATHTLTVDASRAAIARAKASVLGRAAGGEHRFLAEDVFALLPRLERRGETFDHVVVDPPTHARTKRHRFNSGRDWIGLAARCARLCRDGGCLWASSNDHRMDVRAFEGMLRRGVEQAGFSVEKRRISSPPLDFPHAPGSPPHQKMVVLTLRRGL